MPYEIVRYSPEYADQVIDLQTRLWSPDVAVNRAYFEWKYLRNPYVAPPMAHLVLSGGRVVGMRGMFGARWEAGPAPDVFTVPCAGDFVVLPEHRSAALAMRVIAASADDLATLSGEYVFNLTAGAATHLASSLTGWRSIGPIQTATRLDTPADPEDALPFASLDRRHAAATASHGVVLEDGPRPAAMAALIRRLGHDGRIRHVRDAPYLAWRYASPLSRYRFLYSGTPAVDGYLVLRAPAHGWQGQAEIVDWEAATDEVRRRLLAAAVEWGGFPALTIWCATLPAGSIALLQAHGFRLSRPDRATPRTLVGAHPTVLVRPVRNEALPAADWALGGRRLLDIESWDLRMIYQDL